MAYNNINNHQTKTCFLPLRKNSYASQNSD